jgi:micrococcal nuclease
MKIHGFYIVFIAFSIISIVISNSQALAAEDIWRDYDSMKELVKDIRNGDKDDDKMNYDKFKDSSVYKNAKEDLRKCVDLANKVGEKLGDYEIVRCFENTNYFKEKYVEDNNQNVDHQLQRNGTNQNENGSDQTTQQEEVQLAENNNKQEQEQEQQNVTNQNQTSGEIKNQTESSVGSNDGCDPSYPDICITTYSENLSCADIPFKNFKVLPPDSHGFDSDSNGLGCEG